MLSAAALATPALCGHRVFRFTRIGLARSIARVVWSTWFRSRWPYKWHRADIRFTIASYHIIRFQRMPRKRPMCVRLLYLRRHKAVVVDREAYREHGNELANVHPSLFTTALSIVETSEAMIIPPRYVPR